ncbi:MAG: adenosylcobalamin-dependent ribonucleoside-diphosphate reductase [bacterium]|nr:adenosylcobalamin-dependent ribonucleoside-diphosphate reductase [bacterium]
MSDQNVTLAPAPISTQIWGMKYRFGGGPGGEGRDATIPATWRRIARALAAVEDEAVRPEVETRFREALEGFRFLPAGRIVAGAGTDRNVTLFNCFVMGTIPDDMSGIFENLKEAALTMQAGGGIGYDFSTLRPKGAAVKGVGADASGPLPFMDCWDSMCRTIMSAGSRRGAMMATMRCDHPDIEAFIDAKQEAGRLRMFNLSVLVTDAFMAAVEADGAWDLSFDGVVHGTRGARELWDRIMRGTYACAEPGVIFIDRINRRNNLHYCETISATNPCGEQPLPPYGACLLGSINLTRFITDPFGDEARFDAEAFSRTVEAAVRMMDNVIDVSRFPLEEQRQEALAKRRIGLGVTGLADALIMMKAHYGSERAREMAGTWLARLRRQAYLASIRLASEKGPFPLFDRDAYLAGESMAELDGDVRQALGRHGIRNALLTSIAPTGTISLFANNISSGLEPVFAFSYTRHVLLPDGTRRSEEVTDYAVRLWRHLRGEDAPLPDYFVDAQQLRPTDHVAMQATVQEYIDSSISKTINVPEEIPFEDFKGVYLEAYRGGCKGCTTYRPNDVTGAVLETGTETREPQLALEETPSETPGDAFETAGVIHLTQPLDRPEVLPGQTYKLRWPESDHAIYLTVNDVVRDSRRCPFEVFINSKNMDHYAWTLGLTRMISAVFRRGGDVSFVVEELKAVFDPRGGSWMNGRYVPSLLAALGEVLEEHMRRIGFIAADDEPVLSGEAGAKVVAISGAGGGRAPAACPRCSQPSLIHQEGCAMCTSCGYSKCA